MDKNDIFKSVYNDFFGGNLSLENNEEDKFEIHF